MKKPEEQKKRATVFHIRKDQFAKIERLAAKKNLSQAEIIRRLLDKALPEMVE